MIISESCINGHRSNDGLGRVACKLKPAREVPTRVGQVRGRQHATGDHEDLRGLSSTYGIRGQGQRLEGTSTLCVSKTHPQEARPRERKKKKEKGVRKHGPGASRSSFLSFVIIDIMHFKLNICVFESESLLRA